MGTRDIYIVRSRTFNSALQHTFAAFIAQAHNTLTGHGCPQGVSPLRIAAALGQLTAVQMLLAYGADAEARDKKVSIKWHANNSFSSFLETEGI